MLWQHDPTRPIGVWDEVREDGKGLWVKGRLLPDVAQAREAAALIQAGAIDGLSIGYRTLRAERDKAGRRVLAEVELWEVSLVTFPMLAEAKVDRKDSDEMRDVAALFVQAAQALRAFAAEQGFAGVVVGARRRRFVVGIGGTLRKFHKVPNETARNRPLVAVAGCNRD